MYLPVLFANCITINNMLLEAYCLLLFKLECLYLLLKTIKADFLLLPLLLLFFSLLFYSEYGGAKLKLTVQYVCLRAEIYDRSSLCGYEFQSTVKIHSSERFFSCGTLHHYFVTEEYSI